MPLLGMNAERTAIFLGFGITVLGLLLTQFYVEPAQKDRSDIQERLSASRAKAKILSSANATNNIFGQLGSMVFTLNSHDQPNEAGVEAVQTLQLRAIDWRHDGVRTYIAQLGVAGEVDYKPTAAAYERLVDDEIQLGTDVAYRKANEFEADLSMKAVTDTGNAAMDAIRLHSAFFNIDAIVQYRKLILMIVTVLGSAFILVATLIAMSPKPARKAAPAAPEGVDIASAISALEAALAEIHIRVAEAQGAAKPPPDNTLPPTDHT